MDILAIWPRSRGSQNIRFLRHPDLFVLPVGVGWPPRSPQEVGPDGGERRAQEAPAPPPEEGLPRDGGGDNEDEAEDKGRGPERRPFPPRLAPPPSRSVAHDHGDFALVFTTCPF